MSEQKAATLDDATRVVRQIAAIAQLMQMTMEAEPSQLSEATLSHLGCLIENLACEADNIIHEVEMAGAQ